MTESDMVFADDRQKLADFVLTDASPMAILGAAVKLVEVHGSAVEKHIARAVDATVKSHVAVAVAGRRAGF